MGIECQRPERDPQCLGRRESRRLCTEQLDQLAGVPSRVGEEHVCLGREVPEERALGYTADLRDLLDARGVESLACKEIERCRDERLPQERLLALADAWMDGRTTA